MRAADNSYHWFGVSTWQTRREGGREGQKDGRASLLFSFDYSIISGRFGAMGDVFVSCLSLVANGRRQSATRRRHVTSGILETGTLRNWRRNKDRAAFNLPWHCLTSQETLLMHDEDVCLAAVLLLVGGAAVRTGIYVLAHPGLDLRGGDLSCHTCM